jgi:hypothetical protein
MTFEPVAESEAMAPAAPTPAQVVVAEPAPKPKGRVGAPKWETDARERVRSMLKKMAKPLADIVTRDANEGDTRILVTDLLVDGLGYDKYEDLTTEYQVRGEFADYGIRVDKQLVAFLESKRATTKLNPKHLRQVEAYALNEGVEWVILSNGAHWQVYHIGVAPGMPVLVELAIDVDLLGPETLAHKADRLFYITKEAFKRRLIDQVWKERVATSPKSVAAILLSDAVVDAARKELRRRTGHQIDSKTVEKLLRESVIRPDCL